MNIKEFERKANELKKGEVMPFKDDFIVGTKSD